MQRGAYEAMALEKPLITSNFGVLRETFCDGTIHVDNSAAGIAAAIERAMSERSELALGMQRLRRQRAEAFAAKLSALQTLIEP
jgi:glycosyltransferase involved in cell wall biosynthesis